jgi:hypothetical protein
MRNILIKMFIGICLVAILVGSVTATAVILATSNTIHIVVTQPAIVYNLSLTANGQTANTYSGALHPGDTIHLVATSNTPQAVGKTVTFLSLLTISWRLFNESGIGCSFD